MNNSVQQLNPLFMLVLDIKRILRAPLSYFDVTPLSKILIVFAKHQYCMDDVFSDNMLQVHGHSGFCVPGTACVPFGNLFFFCVQFLSFLPLVLGVSIFVMVLIPWTVIVAAVLAFCVWALMHLSRGVEERFQFLEGELYFHILLLSVMCSGTNISYFLLFVVRL